MPVFEITYPKGALELLAADRTPVEFGKSEVLLTGDDGAILACGAMAPAANTSMVKLPSVASDTYLASVSPPP